MYIYKWNWVLWCQTILQHVSFKDYYFLGFKAAIANLNKDFSW